MRILQFLCPYNPPSDQLKQLMTDQMNTWSRLRWLSTDPDYITAPFTVDIWKEHTTITGLYWFDYDSVYNNIGDDGRSIADQMLGNGALQGILKMAPLVQSLPGTKLELLDVEDMIAEGYILADTQDNSILP